MNRTEAVAAREAEVGAPTDTRRPLWLALGLLLASLAVGAVSYNRSWSLGDDGNLMLAAMRVARGEVPFVDFVHYFYSPGRVYLVAGLFELTGESYLALRGLWVAVRTASVLLAFAVARRFVPDTLALLPAVVVLLVGGPWFKSFYALCSLVGLFACLAYTKQPSTARAAGIGLGIAFTLYFRQDMGIAAAGLAALALLGTHLAAGRPARALLAHAASALAVPAALLLPFLAYMASEGALVPMLEQLFVVSPSLTAGDEPVQAAVDFMRASTYQGLVYGAPLLAGLLALGFARNSAPRERLDLLLLSAAAALALLPAYTAPGLIRFYQAHHVAWVLLVAVLWRLAAHLFANAGPTVFAGLSAGMLRRYAFVLLVPALFTADALHDRGRRAGIPKWSGVLTTFVGRDQPVRLAGERVYVAPPRQRWLPRLVRFTKRHAAPTDNVIFLPSGSLLNWVCDRPNGTRYIDVWALNYLENPVGQAIAEEYMAGDFAEADPALVFVRMGGRRLERSWLGRRLRAEGYEPVRVFGPYTVFVPPAP